MYSVLSRLFDDTTGNIQIVDPTTNFELLTRNFQSILLAACEFPDAYIDPVTDTGDCNVVFIHGDGHAMYPPPSLAYDEGGLYLGEGRPLEHQPQGKTLLPLASLLEFEDLTFYSLNELVVEHRAALEKFQRPIPKIDPTHLEGRTKEEKMHLEELHQRCAIGLRGNNLCVIWQPERDKPAKFLSVRDAAEREGNRVVYVKDDNDTVRKKNMFKEWKEWPGRVEYDEIKFAPGRSDPGLYNLFSGWKVKAKPGDWSKLRDHIRLVICDGNHEQFQWLMTWLADIFQNPQSKPPVAVVVRGKKGTGKSILFDFVQRLMPAYFYKVADGKRALGSFNAAYETTLLLLMEEAIPPGNQAMESILKDLITSRTIPIERKGMDTYMATSFMRIAMNSNEHWVVPASADERRFALFDCNDQHRGDHAYFKVMADQMENGGLEAMLYDLLTFQPEGGWDILREAPASSGLKEQVIASLRGLNSFMYELLSSGMYGCDKVPDGGIFLNEDRGTSINMTDLRHAARDHLADSHPGQKSVNFDQLTRAVSEWASARVVVRDGIQNKTKWVEFPSLAECRQHIRRTKGIVIAPPVQASDSTPIRKPTRLRAVGASE